MNDAIQVADRFEALRDYGAYRRGTIMTVRYLRATGGVDFQSPFGATAELLCRADVLRRLPREDAAPKLTVPRVAVRLEDLKPGMRVRFSMVIGDRTLRRQGGALCAFPDNDPYPSCNFKDRPEAFEKLSPITILADPKQPATAVPRELSPDILGPAETQALIEKCSAMVAAQEKRTVSVTYQPCRTHNMPMPCVECSLNASHATAAFAREYKAAHDREMERQRAAREARERLPVIKPWAMMDGVQGPGWSRRGR